MTDLTQILIAAANADKNAENSLNEWQERNFPEFVNALAAELATEGRDIRARQLAGITVKNLLAAIDENLQIQKHDAWKALQEEARQGVKVHLLQALRSKETMARHTAAQAAAEVATIEVPYDAWPEFLPAMLENITTEAHGQGTRIASLECLGYTCERMGNLDVPEISETTTNTFLTAIVDGIQKTRPEDVRLAAACALKNSLVFTQNNFEKKEERNAIMSTVCEATISPDRRVRKEAFDCLQTIAFLYYEQLHEYMIPLFDLTTNAIKADEESVATMALEFWNVLAETEEEMLLDEAELQDQNIQSERTCQRYTSSAVEHVVPLLLEAMTKQAEDADLDFDQFGLSIAANTSLGLIAQTVGDQVTPAVLPFVQQHIQSENWHYRDAATMAFASILEGATADSIAAVVHQSIAVLIRALNDTNTLVQHSTLWAISKICELHSRSIPQQELPTLVNGLLSKLDANNTPHVARQAANALFKLGSAFDSDATGQTTGTNLISPFLQNLLQQLMTAADRHDANEANLRVAAFEAMNCFLTNSAPDSKPLLLQLLPVANERLKATFGMQMEKECKDGLQGLLCSMIQVLCQKLDRENITPLADNIMQNVLQVLQVKSSSAQQEALSAIAALADAVELDFEKYMSALQPYLLVALRQFEAYGVCNVAVGLVGDVSRALEAKIEPFTKDIMEALVESLKDPTLHRSVKPCVLSCFGEIATAINFGYEPYLQLSMMLLMQASATDAPQEDDEMVEYINGLRECVLEAYTGIITGLADGNRLDLMTPYIGSVLQFLNKIANDQNRDDALMQKAIGLIGDVTQSMGKAVKVQINQPFIASLLQEGARSPSPETVNVANWAMGVVQALIQSA